MTEKTNEKSPTNVTFGLITHPDRAGWPIHGCFKLLQDGKRALSGDMFSVDACREHIKLSIEDGYLNSDQAAELERQIIATGLPVAENRYDKISKTYTKTSEYERLIGQFCGALPPEEGSGPARFEACQHGRCCKLESCAKLPIHAQLFPKGIVAGFKSVVFSQQGATDLLKQAVEYGLLLQEEANGLKPRVMNLSASSGAERADKLCQHLTGELLEREIDLAFGFRQRANPPHFAACGQHYHLRLDGHISSATRLENEFDAKLVLDELTQAGFLSNEEQTKLLDDLATMHLPPGSETESAFNPSSVLRERHEDEAFEAFLSLLLGR
ncbi:MAG: hypothetical protein PHC53_00915 [Patescibacteria group bacterium]|nr:hypothetical protein [Patescibacteria group bacterium]